MKTRDEPERGCTWAPRLEPRHLAVLSIQSKGRRIKASPHSGRISVFCHFSLLGNFPRSFTNADSGDTAVESLMRSRAQRQNNPYRQSFNAVFLHVSSLIPAAEFAVLRLVDILFWGGLTFTLDSCIWGLTVASAFHFHGIAGR